MEITFRKFDHKTHQEQHRALFAECFPEVYNQNDYPIQYEGLYIHQYKKFPAFPTSYQFVAMADSEMIGYYASLPYRYKIGYKVVTAGMVCGVMTSPSYRKMGIFTKLGSYAANEQKAAGVSFNLTFPIRKSVMPGFMRMGWDVVFEMPLYMRFLRITSLLKSKKLGFLSFLINPFISLYNSLCKKNDNKAFVIKIHSSVDEIAGYDDFLKKWNASIKNTLIKDEAFLKWRYSSPGKEYLFFCAYTEHSLVGFISARAIIREGVPSFGILDFMVTDKACLTNMHNAVYNRAKAEKKEAIMMMMSKHSSKSYQLPGNGYLKSPYRFHLIMNNLAKDFSKEDLYNEASWHLMFVDSDDL